ncbi:MAG TPA: hypothetical protein VGV69_02760 [Solirubrobacterales bacterium]|nr:hypothetical protein [Solirubrobacterales bacterium]
MAEERHPLSDQVLVILKRAWPGEVEKEDLIEQSGLGPQDLDEVMGDIRRHGEVDESGEHFAWRNPEAPHRELAASGQTEQPAADERAEGDALPDERLDLPDHALGRVQVQYLVTGSFAPGRNPNDEGLKARSAKIGEEIGNVLGQAMPGLGANVAPLKAYVFDKPRVLFDATDPSPEEESEP